MKDTSEAARWATNNPQIINQRPMILMHKMPGVSISFSKKCYPDGWRAEGAEQARRAEEEEEEDDAYQDQDG